MGHTSQPFYQSGQMRHAARDLRDNATPAEALLWECLRGNRLDGYRFRRQHPLGRFVVDFYCHAARLVIEIDGGYHDDPAIAVAARERAAGLQSQGLVVLRFRNEDVLQRTADVLRVVSKALAKAQDAKQQRERDRLDFRGSSGSPP